MPSQPLDVLPVWAIFLFTIVVIILAHELGYRIGRKRALQASREADPPVGAMVGAELGLLAFFMAFTFGMAATRFDERRQTLLDETNAIGTAWLRAAMLPEPHRAPARRLLREYADTRLRATQPGQLADAIRHSEEIHRTLWTEAIGAAEKDTRSVMTGLFIEAVNEVIDLHSKRVVVGVRMRIPLPVWAVLFGAAFLSFLALGYGVGLTKSSRSPAVFVVTVTFAAVVWLIADLDRPGGGLLRVSQQPMIELRDSMTE